MINTTTKKAINPTPANSEAIISIEGVSKKFCRDLKRSLFYGVQDIVGDLLALREQSDRLRTKEFWALDNVSLQLKRGEALGLVGKNGSGKSTLLRIIAGLIKPDMGMVKVRGRVAPLIALGAGFNPVLTGRENIYANMSILGLSTKEIDDRFDEVVEFAEIGDAIDAPVQTYSSGMAARLGFASAIHTEPDILLVDEVLAVGDIKFRSKCHRKLTKMRQKGVSVILVSHNPQSLLSVCDSAGYLAKGKLMMSGEINIVMSKYEEDIFITKQAKHAGTIRLPNKAKIESLGADFTLVCFKDETNKIVESPISGRQISLCVKLQAHRTINNVAFQIVIRELHGEGEPILVLNCSNDNFNLEIPQGESEIQLILPFLCLKAGSYIMKIELKENLINTIDWLEKFTFVVLAGGKPIGNSKFYQPRSWNLLSDCSKLKS